MATQAMSTLPAAYGGDQVNKYAHLPPDQQQIARDYPWAFNETTGQIMSMSPLASGNIGYNGVIPAGGGSPAPTPGAGGTGAPAWGGSTGGSTGGGAGGAGGMGAGVGMSPGQSAVMNNPAGASTVGQNPYLAQMGNVMTGQMTDAFNRQVMPGIAAGAASAGGYGGSRQGVVEANAMNDLGKQMGGALTNLYGQGYNTSLQYDLGLRGNDLGFAGLDAQIAQNNFNNQLNGANFGLGMYDRLQAGNQAGITAGTNIQNTPMNYWSQFANQANSIGQGYGTTTGTTQQQGNPMASMLGGAQLGSQIFGGGGGYSGGGLTGANSGGYNIGSYDYSLGNGNTGLGLSGGW